MRILAVTSGRPAREGGSDGADASIIPTILDANTNAATTQRSIALTVGPEGLDPAEAVFFSSKAEATLRPRMQLTYVPRVTLGLP